MNVLQIKLRLGYIDFFTTEDKTLVANITLLLENKLDNFQNSDSIHILLSLTALSSSFHDWTI